MLDLRELSLNADAEMKRFGDEIAETVQRNTLKVLDCFREAGVAAWHFSPSTGYGYNDRGRDKLDELFALVFGGEDALVRQQIVSGTHAITLCLFGNLLPGDELLSVGQPYDTLRKIIGAEEKTPGSLCELGVKYREVEIDFSAPDPLAVAAAVGVETKMLMIQRSRGYKWRDALSVARIGEIIKAVKARHPRLTVFVDNCYGEMVEEKEPTQVGADLMAGSLIKNAGAGIAPSGGYIVGKKNLVERASYRLTMPGGGREVGASLADNRLFFQALFLSPLIVGEALCGAVYAASLLEAAGFPVSPAPREKRSDIIQAARLGSAERLIQFCQEIQRNSPVDSFAKPLPGPLPGYKHEVIMAAGAFVQGSSIELSADAPLKEPYNVFCREVSAAGMSNMPSAARWPGCKKTACCEPPGKSTLKTHRFY
ncbi:MAG: methionine gamma-lyase family protein, partial [Clostridiales bacterium]|nr:methionine gamma-lyase family protein [Clostridiales bacterium]